MITFSRENEKMLQNLKKVTPETYYHCIRVKKLVLSMLGRINADHNCYDQQQIDVICKGALLHDIGKLFVQNYVLTKASSLTEEEMELMCQHAHRGGEALRSGLEDNEAQMILEICQNHHDRIGPEPGDEEKMPLYVQAVAICDAYDALVNDRVYHAKYPKEKALEMIEKGECGRFSPYMIQCLKDITRDLVH